MSKRNGMIEYANGDREWWRDGKRHREDGPAVELANGSRFWCRNGKLHREDGPAIEYPDGYRAWYRYGELHREDGPAVEYADGTCTWCRDGMGMTQDEFLRTTPDEHLPAVLTYIAERMAGVT